jgi:hypothetical protein
MILEYAWQVPVVKNASDGAIFSGQCFDFRNLNTPFLHETMPTSNRE